jgi:hypothetical protein
MRIYLDDQRRAPFGWDLVKTADDCIARLSTGKVVELSLDHDLAEEHYERVVLETVDANPDGYQEFREAFREKTGYSVVQWMIEHGVWPELIILHTMNPVGRADMRRAIERYAPEHVKLEVRVGWRG